MKYLEINNVLSYGIGVRVASMKVVAPSLDHTVPVRVMFYAFSL